MLKKVLIVIGIIAICYGLLYFWPTSPNDKIILGVSFDPAYARFLGLDDKIVFDKIIKDWNFKYLRYSAHWDAIEIKQNKFDFRELDNYFNLAKDNNLQIILAVGQKTPRWPECRAPEWAVNLSDQEYFDALNNYVETVASRYKNNPAFEIVQVENEPFFQFGEKCRKMPSDQLAREIVVAKAGDKPTLTTDSGEMSTWRRTAKATDWFGTTLYRVVWNKFVGYFSYDWLPANFYRLKFWLNGRDVKTAIVSELQAEPWLPGNNPMTAELAEGAKSMTVERMQKNIAYAGKLGVSRAYLWGAEWWVWLETKGDLSFSDYLTNPRMWAVQDSNL